MRDAERELQEIVHRHVVEQTRLEADRLDSELLEAMALTPRQHWPRLHTVHPREVANAADYVGYVACSLRNGVE